MHEHNDHHNEEHHDEHENHDIHDPLAQHEHEMHEHNEHQDEHSEQDFEDEEETEIPKLIDISLENEKELDLSQIFILSEIAVYRKIFKQNTKDLTTSLNPQIKLSKKLKIKLSKNKKPINDIKKVIFRKDLKPRFEKQNYPKDSLNLKNISDLPPSSISQEKLIFDMKGPKTSVIKMAKKHFFNISTISYSFKLKSFKILSYLMIFVFFLGFYGLFIKLKIDNTFENIKNISSSKNIITLKNNLEDIRDDFFTLKLLLNPVFFINQYFENQQVSNLQFVVLGGSYLSNFATNSIELYDGIHDIITKKGPSKVMYSQLFKNINPITTDLKQNLDNGILELSKVKNLPNKDINILYIEKLEKLKQVQKYVNIFYQKREVLEDILGDKNKKTYLVIFQNSDEIRPTGGFMGSVGIAGIFKGKLVSFEKKDIYALEWPLKPFTQKAPEGINQITPTFGLRDANYFSSIKENSEKIKEFVDKTGINIDAIMYINQNVITDSLDKTGGFYFSKIKNDINSQNFSMIMSALVESKISKTHTLSTPKQILFDFMEEYFTFFKKRGDYFSYLNILFNSIEKKDIIIYSFSQKENELLSQIGLYKENDYHNYLDFSYPLFTSISGNKSDRYIKRSFEKRISYNTDCSVNTKFLLKQQHTFSQNTESSIKKFFYDSKIIENIDYDSSMFIQGKGPNKQFIRILIPPQAQISSSKYYEITQKDDFKEISFYTETLPGENSEFTIKYTLANPECRKYSFKFYKQPGLKKFDFSIFKEGNLVKNISAEKDLEF